jgi:phospholipid/cholesterol/gamma-HCH transport system substrate-binding protein
LKISREIKTAILCISSILLFIWGYNFLKGKDLLHQYKTFYVVYDNIEGLDESASITINGLVIGKINRITIDNATGKLLVELQVKTKFPISKSSVANIYETGLIGGKQIQIIPNFEDKSLAVSGDTLKSGVVPGMVDVLSKKIEPLQRKMEAMIVNADSLLVSVNKVLDAKTRENLRSTIANLNQTMIEFHTASKSVNGMLAENKSKINHTITNIDNLSTNFSAISDSLAKANIGKMVKDLEQTLTVVNKMMTDMESGKGTMGKLIKDDALYNNLNQTSIELELLLEDVRLNPTRYINVSMFGKKNKPYVAPTETINKDSEQIKN